MSTQVSVIPPTDPTLVSGMRDQSTTLAKRVIVDAKDEIGFWDPEAAPLCSILMALRGKRKGTQERIDWFEKKPYPRLATTSAAVTAGAVTVNVSTGEGSRFAANYLCINRRTRELFLVTGVSTDALTVVRAIGGTTGIAMNAGDTIEILHAVAEDGAGIGTLKSVAEENEYNLFEIIRRPFGWTGRQANTAMYGGKDPATEKRFQAIEHKKDIEAALLFGKRNARTGSGGRAQNTMGGLEYFTRNLVWDLNGNTPTEAGFVASLEYGMEWGNGGYRNGRSLKYLFCGPRLMTIAESWVRDRVRYEPLSSKLGLKFLSYTSSHGEVRIIRHPLLVGPQHGGMAFLLDMNHIRYAYFQGRDTKLYDNRQANDIDGEQYEWMTDCSMEFMMPQAHMLIKGIPAQ